MGEIWNKLRSIEEVKESSVGKEVINLIKMFNCQLSENVKVLTDKYNNLNDKYKENSGTV